MATLPFEPKLVDASSAEITPKVLRNDFGDSYSQRAADGMNYVPQTWNLKWELKGSDADILLAFMVSHGGHTTFEWTPPRGVQGKYVFQNWGWTPMGTSVFLITARISQEYDS